MKRLLLGKPPKMHRDVKTVARAIKPIDLTGVDLQASAIALSATQQWRSKRFLITIGDRTWATSAPRPDGRPVASAGGQLAVTLADYQGFGGEAMSMGERTPLAAVNAAASGRMAVAEAITNLLAAPIELPRVKLSANWMAACGEAGQDAALYETVKAVGMELCPALGVSIPVGKDWLFDAHQSEDRAMAATNFPPIAGIADRQRLRHAGRRARHARPS